MHTAARREIGLELTREQSALIVEGLAERPFRQVFELIGLLHAGGGARVAPCCKACSSKSVRNNTDNR
jgi:hypothetical protein